MIVYKPKPRRKTPRGGYKRCFGVSRLPLPPWPSGWALSAGGPLVSCRGVSIGKEEDDRRTSGLHSRPGDANGRGSVSGFEKSPSDHRFTVQDGSKHDSRVLSCLFSK